MVISSVWASLSPAPRSLSRTPAGTAFATYFAASLEGKEMTALSSVVFCLMPPPHKRMEESGTVEREYTVVMEGQGRDQKHSRGKKGDRKRRRRSRRYGLRQWNNLQTHGLPPPFSKISLHLERYSKRWRTKSKQDTVGKKNQGQTVEASEPPCQRGEKHGPFAEKASPPTEAPLSAW